MPSASSHEEATCSACKRPPKDAVTATCGHTFCPLCLVPPSGMGTQPSCKVLLCPLCKEKGHIDPVTVPVPLGTLEEMHCEDHGEKVCFFCGHDAELLCTRCREGPSHHTHTVGFLDGAGQPSQDGLRTQLEDLRVEREEIEDIKSQEDQKLQMLLTHIERKKQQVEAVFEKLQQELREQRDLLLARLSGLEVQICKEREEYISKFSEEVARCGAEAEELEKCQQPDVRVSHSRCEKTFVSPETISPALVKKIRDLHRKILPLPEMLRTFSESLVHYLETDSGAGTWDPPAASWSTALSEDRKPTRFTRDQQDLPHCPRSSEGAQLRAAPPPAPPRDPAGRECPNQVCGPASL